MIIELLTSEDSHRLVVGVCQKDEPRLRPCLSPLEVVKGMSYHVLEEGEVGLLAIFLRAAHVVELIVQGALFLEELMMRRA